MSAPRPLRAAAFLALVVCLVGGILATVPQAAAANSSTFGVRATADQLATVPEPATGDAPVARASEAAQRSSVADVAAADPVGCGYGQGGQYDDTICWLDMTGYNDTQARTDTGQDMTVTLPGGYTLRYNIKTTVAPGGPDRGIAAVATPIERQPNGDSRFAFGSEAYRNIPGRPSLYSLPGGAGLDVTLSRIRLEDSSGNPVSSFSFVATDTEDNVASAGESLRWTSDKNLNLIETLYPNSTKGCRPAGITGLGTTQVTCVGAGGGSTLAEKSTSILVSADAPSTFALRWITGARSGIAFGINTASVEVTKVVQGRAATTDSFDVSISSPEGSNLATASTGADGTATTGRVVVIPPINGGAFTLTDAVTPGSGTDMGKYTRSWSCTRNGQPDPSLPSGSAATVQVSPGANESIACTVTNTAILDFGDAPNSYGTLAASNGAQHGSGGPTLGATRDDEIDGQPTSAADGDDTTGTDDEDGVAFNTDVSIPGRLETVFVTSTGAGVLNAWIDFNRDGDFDGGVERIFADRAVVNGVNRLTYTVPDKPAFVGGEAAARFRVAAAANQATSPTGSAPNGEVEDYSRTLYDAEAAALAECPRGSFPTPVGIIQNQSFETRTGPFANVGSPNTINFAQHWFDAHPSGGQYYVFAPDFDSGPTQSVMPFRAGADGYGFLGGHSSGPGDSGEGATNTLAEPMVPGAAYVGFFSIGAGGHSRNGSGHMQMYGTSDVGAGSINTVKLTTDNSESLFNTPNVSPATGGARAQWRLSTFQLRPTEAWQYLRVESRNQTPANNGSPSGQTWMTFDDFHLYLCDPIRDFGDAPATYGTALGDNPAFHEVPDFDDDNSKAPLMLGSSLDVEDDGSAGTAADGDDTDAADDEDALDGPISLTVGSATTVSVPVTNDTAQSATLAAWVDLDASGTFDPAERVTRAIPAGSGLVDYDVTLPAPAVAGTTYARLRLFEGDVADPSPTGIADAGEVEDHVATIAPVGPAVACDTDPAIFNTAYNGNGGELAPGSSDLNWQAGLGDAAGPASVTDWIPAWVTSRPSAWAVSRFGNADWISYYTDTGHSGRVNVYFRYQFRIVPEVSLDAFAMPMNFYADNSVPEVWVNGVAQSAFHPGKLPQSSNVYQYQGYSEGNRAKIVLSNSFQHGPNTVVVRVGSDGPNMGFMAQVGPSPLCADAGDAPAPYGTTKADNGATHGLDGYDDDADTADLMLGDSVDADVDGVPSAAADSDDNARTDDEDGVAIPIEMTVGEPTVIDVSATSSGAATLSGWLDVDADGTFEAAEQITVPVAAGTRSYELTFPAAAPTAGATYARFRLFPGTVAAPSPTGAATAGEVEDYRVTVLRPGLDIEKTSDATADTRPGDIVNYTVTLTNTGDGAFTAANPARMVDDLGGVLDDATYNGDAVATVDGGAVSAPTYSAPRIRWDGPLAAGKSVVIEYSVTVEGGGDGTARNVAWVPNGPTPGPKPDCNDPATTVPCATSEFLLPKLTVSKTASRNTLPSVGEEITYTVTVRNAGPGSWSADEPGLVDDLSDVEDNATMVSSPTTTSGTATYDPVDAELAWSGALNANQSATITYTFRYDGGGNQSLVNSACVPADNALDPLDNCRTTTTPGSGLDQAKTSSPASGTAVDAGDEITYTLRFSNTGQTTATIGTTDDLSAVLDDASITAGPTADAGLAATLVGDALEIDGSVPVGETLFVTYTVTLKNWADQGDHLLRNELACQSANIAACDPGVVEHPARRLVVDKAVAQAPADPRPGDQVTYTVTATNPGPGDYTAAEPAVVLDDLSEVLDDGTLDAGATATIGGNPVAAPTTAGDLLSWSGALQAGETVTITYTITLQGGGDGTVHNTVFVPDCDPGASDCDPTRPDCVRGTDPATGLSCDSEELLLPKLSIEKEAGPAHVTAVGDEITYTVTITNDGPGDYSAAEPATFTDDLTDVLEDATYVAGSETAAAGTASYAAPNLTWSGPLPSGQSVDVTYKVSYTGADDQTLENTACFPVAEAAQGSDECASVTIHGPDLSQMKTSDPADGTDVRVGQEIHYTLTFTNDGEAPARVDTTDDLSDVLDDADLVGTPSAQAPLVATLNGNSLDVTGEVPAGETRTVTYAVVVIAAGDGVLANSLACQTGAPPTCDPETTEHEVQSLEITKSSDADDDTRLGDTVTYTVTVHNPGAAYTAAQPAVVVDDLTGVLDDGGLVGTPTAEIGGVPVGAPTFTDPRLRWEGPLAANATLVITYQVRLTAGGDGVVRNVAWVPQGPPGTTPDCDDPALDLPCAEEDFTVPRLSVSKTADRTDLPARGERVTYTVVVRNDGPGDYTAADPATFTDDLSDVLDDATLVAGSITATIGNATFASPDLSWTGVLAAGQSATITYTVEYNGDGDRILSNSACVPANQAVTPAANCDTVTVPGSGLVQTKTSDPADGSAVRAGQEITYTLSFTNHGQAPATVNTSDDLSAVLDDADLTEGPTAEAGLTAEVDGDLIRITGSVPAGQTLTMTYTVTVSPYGDQGDHVLRNALACAPGSPAACQPETTIHPVRHLLVSKSSDATDAVDTGSVVTYTITVLNDGATAYTAGDPASFVDDLSDVLDDAIWNDDAEATSGGLGFTTPTLTWSGPLGVGASVTITYSVTVTNAGDHDLRNTVDVPDCDDACEPPPVVTPLPYVVPDKTVDPPSGTAVSAGQVVTYTLSWTNNGQADGVVDATDDLSDVLDDARLTGDPVSSDPDVVVTREGETLRIEGPIEVGQTVTVTYQVTVRPDGQRGDNRLGNELSPDIPQVDCDDDADDIGDCDPVDPPDTENPVGEYEDWKTSDPISGREVDAGERITYTLHFRNSGNANVDVDRDDVLTRVLDDAVIVRQPKSSSSALSVSKVINGRFSVKGELSPGQKVTVSYTVRVKPRKRLGDLDLANFLVDDGQRPPRHCNVGTSSAADRRKDCTEHQVLTYDLTVAKDLMTDSPVGVGTMVKYRIVVTNKGPDAATDGIKVLDNLPKGLDLRAARGKGWDCTLRHAGDHVTCVRTKVLPRGAKTPPVYVIANVRSSAAGSRVVNTAKVAGAGDTNPSNNDDPAVLVVEDIPPLPDTGMRHIIPGSLFG